MATLLESQLVTDALRGLQDWSGDTNAISRTVKLSGGNADELLGEVATAADSMNHHPDVERSGDQVTFRLSTHSAGGVTELDIALASRIDDLVRKVEPSADGELRSVVGATGAAGAVAGKVTEAEPTQPGRGTTPATPEESETGEPVEHGAGLLHPPGNPREGAGPILAPDTKPGSPEPMPRPEGGPGMHEPEPEDDDRA